MVIAVNQSQTSASIPLVEFLPAREDLFLSLRINFHNNVLASNVCLLIAACPLVQPILVQDLKTHPPFAKENAMKTSAVRSSVSTFQIFVVLPIWFERWHVRELVPLQLVVNQLAIRSPANLVGRKRDLTAPFASTATTTTAAERLFVAIIDALLVIIQKRIWEVSGAVLALVKIRIAVLQILVLTMFALKERKIWTAKWLALEFLAEMMNVAQISLVMVPRMGAILLFSESHS
jgi:hypothetical protein